MRSRNVLTGMLLGAGSLAGTLLFRRRLARQRERVDVYFGDGSMVPLAAAASLASGLPFLIVRKEAKDYGTANRLEGVFEDGECVCLVEDVVTSGGAAVAAIEALREAGLTCRTAVCVVDREEGGVDALARVAVRLRPLFRASELVGLAKPPQKRDG